MITCKKFIFHFPISFFSAVRLLTICHSEQSQRQLWSKDQDSDPPSDLYNVNESKEWKEWAKYPTLMDQFHQAIIECNKELSSVASAIGRSVGFCLWYYYTKYKPSGNYKVLKARLKQMESEQSKNNDECMICDDGGGEWPDYCLSRSAHSSPDSKLFSSQNFYVVIHVLMPSIQHVSALLVQL